MRKNAKNVNIKTNIFRIVQSACQFHHFIIILNEYVQFVFIYFYFVLVCLSNEIYCCSLFHFRSLLYFSMMHLYIMRLRYRNLPLLHFACLALNKNLFVPSFVTSLFPYLNANVYSLTVCTSCFSIRIAS